jgi:hypothetical protein
MTKRLLIVMVVFLAGVLIAEAAIEYKARIGIFAR